MKIRKQNQNVIILAKKEYDIYYTEFNKYSQINTFSNESSSDSYSGNEENDKNKKTKEKTKKPKKEKQIIQIKNAKVENIPLEEALNEIKEETESLRIKDNKSNIKDISVSENINPAEKNEDIQLKTIEIKGNITKYQNRIFVYIHNSSKYKGKIERKIFFGNIIIIKLIYYVKINYPHFVA